MTSRTIFAYPWDVAEIGAAAAAAEFLDLGLDTVALAGAYHAGKFIRPHGTSGKVYFPEDGAVFFTHDPARYGRIKPRPSTTMQGRDMFAALTGLGTIKVNAWLVLLHNTPLGTAHPDAVVRNAFGDPYVYSLCPSAPAARAYAVALAQDVSDRYPVTGVTLETPGFMPYRHGYHHEFALLQMNSWLENQLGLCFCDHCIAGAEARGIDARGLKAQVAGAVAQYLDSDVDFPPEMAEALWRADSTARGALRDYLDFRQDVVTTLAAEIRAAVRADATVAIVPSLARPTSGGWYEGSDIAALAAAGCDIAALLYQPTAAQVKAELFDLRRRLGGSERLRAVLRPDLLSRGEFMAAVSAIRAAGVADLAVYNWGHLRRERLQWLRDCDERTLGG